MKNIKNITAVIIFLLILNSCKGLRYTSNSQILTQTVNIDPLKGKWIINRPSLNKLTANYEKIIIDGFRKNLSQQTEKISYVQDLKNVLPYNTKNEKIDDILSFYKSQLNYDYLILTDISLLQNEIPQLKVLSEKGINRKLKSKVSVYDLNTKKLIFEKEYYTFEKTAISNNSINITSDNLEKFIEWSVDKITTDFQKSENWLKKT